MGDKIHVAGNEAKDMHLTNIQYTYNNNIFDTADGNNRDCKQPETELLSECQKPICIGMHNCITTFTGREEELEDIHTALNTNKQVVVHGLPGSGKTELVRKYVWDHSSANKECIPAESYYHTIWITAENKAAIEDTIEELAAKLNVSVKREDKKRLQTSIRDSIYNLTGTKKSIFVFDNIEDNSILEDYLPTMQYDNIFILITSQSGNWPSQTFTKVHLEEMSQNDSINLVSQLLLPSILDKNKEHIIPLVDMLGRLPLPIQLAVDFINEMNELEQKSIVQYIEDFQTNKTILLDRDTKNVHYNRTIQDALTLTMNKIKDKISLKILYISSYLAPDDIPKDIFSFLHSEQLEINMTLLNIIRYSLMSPCENGCLKMNRLVQLFLKFNVETDHNLYVINKNDIIIIALNCIFSLIYMLKKHFVSVFEHVEEITTFTGREEELENIHTALKTNKKVVVHGLPGSGKTELVRKYVWDHSSENKECIPEESYYHIIWITAEKNVATKDTIEELATKLNVSVKREEKKRFQTSIRDNIYNLTGTKKSIFIFDNIEDISILEDYLPTMQHDNIFILITSQNGNWPFQTFTKVHLEEMSQNDSINLVSKLLLPSILDKNKEHIISLVNMLGRLPLSIQLAVDFINEMNELEQKSIIQYIEDFQTNKTILLDRATKNVHYDRTIQDALTLTMNKIKNKLSLKILYISSYSAPDNIPKDIFSSLQERLEINTALLNITWYSLMSPCTSDCLKMNRLVQLFLKFNIETNHNLNVFDEDDIIITALNCIFSKAAYKMLHCAVQDNHKSIVRCLIDQEYITTDTKDNDGWSSVHHAAARGNLEMMQMLMKRKFKTDSTTNDGQTILHIAVGKGHKKLVEFLLAERVVVDSKDNRGWSSVHYAVATGYIEMMQMLLKTKFKTDSTTNDGCTILHIAVRNNHKRLVEFLLDERVVVDSRDYYGLSSVHHAAAGGHLEIMQMLMKRKFKTDSTTNDGCTILHLAVENGHNKLVEFLLDEDIMVDSRDNDGWSSVHFAVLGGQLDMLKMLIDRGFSTDSTTNVGETIFHLAVKFCHENLIIFLLNESINVISDDVNELSPNQLTAGEGQSTILTQLIYTRYSQTGNAFDKCTTDLLLEYSVRKGNVEIFNFLFYRGCGNIKNYDNSSLFHLAVIGGNLKIIKKLLEDGVEVISLDNDHNSPLHSAVFETQQNNLAIVEVLLSYGAHVNIKNESGKTPLDMAREKGYTDIAKLLETAEQPNTLTETDENLCNII